MFLFSLSPFQSSTDHPDPNSVLFSYHLHSSLTSHFVNSSTAVSLPLTDSGLASESGILKLHHAYSPSGSAYGKAVFQFRLRPSLLFQITASQFEAHYGWASKHQHCPYSLASAGLEDSFTLYTVLKAQDFEKADNDFISSGLTRLTSAMTLVVVILMQVPPPLPAVMVKTHHNRVYFVEYRSPNPYSFLPSYQFLTELVTGKEPREGDGDMNLAEWAWRYFSEVNSMVEALDPEIKQANSFMEEITLVFKQAHFHKLIRKLMLPP
ncbi:unnamed protein product [Lactuca virosa]|uniref:Uncharacterized protein n=1 Tax=Lactuca virosa TaxID=75947 RepID=A0AAU9N0S0_9ASTR|nr:unnamed protein product [Lactuca virosa]